ncbi:MAG: hypothetical protein JJT88_18175 [Gammaproteobacteria bacterium]|nr:hypothetical protein [Gammaproteobacteria bacterium]
MSKQTLITLAVVLLAGAVIIALLPKGGYNSDVSQVGQGTPAVVLAFENYAPASMDAMALFDRVRRDYQDSVMFLVADLGTPRGRSFADRHQAFSGVVMTFRADGTLAGRGLLESGEAGLRQRLQRELGL